MCSIVLHVDVEQRGRADEVGEALRPRDRDVEAVARDEEVESARRVVARRGGHREEDDRRLLALELVDGADRDAVRAAAPRSSCTCALYGATTMTSSTSSGRVDPSASVHVAAEQPLDLRADRAAASSDDGRVALVLDRQEARARCRASVAWRRALLGGREPAVVERVRDEPADVGVHPARALEEEAPVLGDRRALAEQVLEHRAPALAGMDALRDLRELQRVAEQHERPRARAQRERVRERDLAGLVDEEVVELPVELLAREEPGGAREEVVRRRSTNGSTSVLALDRARSRRRTPDCRRLPSSARGTRRPSRPRRLDLGEQLVDRLVALRGDADPLAAREQVRDEPRARPRLPRAGRALDEEVRALDVARRARSSPRAARLHARAAERRLAPQELSRCGVAAVARAQRAAEPHERLACCSRRVPRRRPG